ncbi:MAG: hypothetical protein HY290_17650 [Planctomycetia bacterium]|nr:hypothetical protein [Planctomycetia bacterium]
MTAQTVTTATGPVTAPTAPASRKRTRAPYRQFMGGEGTASRSGKTAAGSEARRRAAVILEVLAGVQTPTSAAQALGIGAPRYYLLEQHALEGLLSACEPRPRGRVASSDRQIARLERELATCRRELGRQQALARAAHRVLGLKTAAPAVAPTKPGAPPRGKTSSAGPGAKRTRKRRPVVRALRAARVLKNSSSIPSAVGEVQIPAGDAPSTGDGNHLAGTDAAYLATQGAQGG